MANKLLSIEVQGTKNRWSFQFYGDPKHLEEWDKDGLHIEVVSNNIPVTFNAKIWVKIQDIFNFNFRGK